MHHFYENYQNANILMPQKRIHAQNLQFRVKYVKNVCIFVEFTPYLLQNGTRECSSMLDFCCVLRVRIFQTEMRVKFVSEEYNNKRKQTNNLTVLKISH